MKNYKERFRNLPLDSNGKEVPLLDFEHMDFDHLLLWRNHLIDSFSNDSTSERRLQFVTIKGRILSLTSFRLKSVEKDVASNSGTPETAIADEKTPRQKKKGSKKKGVKLPVIKAQDVIETAAQNKGVILLVANINRNLLFRRN